MITWKITVLTSLSHYAAATLTYADLCIILPSFHTHATTLSVAVMVHGMLTV